MARISLRTYHREIESLIERGQYDQAIAHCKHIIQSYPKCVATYRLLGKCFLENQHYSDAADIFQRVLSSIPDDFLSHVGLSMIREDEGNLSDAIWNMERAFEVQPANNAIQAELRRLYGRRDGYEPPKLRLTRGALARMYVKGELYQQAIAEIRAALGEEPDRLDLQTLLAEAYYASGKRVEAAETCSAILSKLPFSLTANRLLAEILADSERASEAGAYRRRVLDLDPYSAHVSPIAPSADHVPDETITIERLSWRPGQTSPLDSSQPDWAASIGVQVNNGNIIDDDIPDWLISAADAAPPSDKSAESVPGANVFLFDDDELEEEEHEVPAPAIANAEEEDFLALFDSQSPEDEEDEDVEAFDFGGDDVLPDWMSDPDWGSSEAESTEEPQEDAAEQMQPSDEALPAVPETDGEALAFSSEEEDIPEWLQSLGGPEEDQDEEAETQIPAEEAPAPPSWMEQDDIEVIAEDKTILESDASEALSIEAEPSAHEDTAVEAEEDLPEWLKELNDGEQIQPIQELDADTRILGENVETPAAFAEFREDESPESEIDIAPGEIPDWLKGLQPDGKERDMPVSPEESEKISEEEQEAAFAWLEGLAARQGADEEELSVSAEERLESPPEWLQAEVESGQGESIAEILEPVAAQEMPEVPSQPEEVDVPVEPVSELEDEDELSEWIVATSVGAAGIESELSSGQSEEIPDSEEMPDWLKDLADEEVAQAAVTPDIFAQTEAGEVEEEPQAIEGELPEWMQSLAPQDEAEPQGEPSMEAGESLDWLLEESEEPVIVGMESTDEEQAEEIESTQPEFLGTPEPEDAFDAEVEVPEWMQEEAQVEALEENAGAQGDIELPDWLMEVAEEAPASPTDELPDWLAEPELAADAAAQAQLDDSAEFEQILSLGDEPPISEEDTQPSSSVLASDEGEPPSEIPVPASITPEPTQPGEWVSEDVEPVFEIPSSDTEQEAAFEDALDVEDFDIEAVLDEHEAPTLISSPISDEDAIADQEQEPAAELPPDEEPEAMELAEEVAQLGLEDDDAAFAWLESLAAKQGVEEALLLSPEERLEEPPDWVKEAALSATGAEEPGEILEETEAWEPAQEPLAELEPESEEALAESLLEESEILETGWEEDAPILEAEDASEAFGEDALEAAEAEVEIEAQLPFEPESPEISAPEEALEIEEQFPPEEIPESAGTPQAAEEEIPELPDWLADMEDTSPHAVPAWRQEAAHAPAEPVDINAAGLADLERLPGVGFVRAQAILAYRRAHGSLQSEADLLKVEGFDPDLVEGLAGKINYAEAGEPPAEEVQAEQETEVHINLTQARNALVQGDTAAAIDKYQELIEDELCLADIITDLHEALFQHPTDLDIIQSLGDAYLRNGQIKDALEAYNKAQQLLR